VALTAVSAALVACVVITGSIIALRFQIYSPIDEGAHFSYVEQIANHGTLPVLGRTLESRQTVAVGLGVDPRVTPINVRSAGIDGLSYEAFQPPLYYVIAVPVFDLSSNYHTKVILLRFFGLLLLLCSIALFGRLCRLVLKERWLYGLATGMLVFALPGMVVSSVNISNSALELPLVIACVIELWQAWEKDSFKHLLWAALLLGLGVLTMLFALAFAPVFLLVAGILVWRQRTRRSVLLAGTAGMVAVFPIVPWLIWNQSTYHQLYAGSIAKAEQISIVNPTRLHYGLNYVIPLLPKRMFRPVLAQELALVGHPAIGFWATVLGVFLTVGAVVVGLLAPRLIASGYWILVLPWLSGVLLVVGITLVAQWPVVLSRYANATLPFLALFIAASVLLLLRDAWAYVATVTGLSVFLIVLWAVQIQQMPLGHSTSF